MTLVESVIYTSEGSVVAHYVGQFNTTKSGVRIDVLNKSGIVSNSLYLFLESVGYNFIKSDNTTEVECVIFNDILHNSNESMSGIEFNKFRDEHEIENKDFIMSATGLFYLNITGSNVINTVENFLLLIG